jgi:adenylate cyclase
MNTPRSIRRPALPWIAAAIAVLAAAVLSLPWSGSWLASAENLAIDLRFHARTELGAHPEPAAIIVGIADSSFTLAERAPAEIARDPALAAMTETWPWNRRVFAELVRRLRAAGARAIVFDIVFESETAGDDEFARVLAEPGAPVVLASLWQKQDSAVGESTVRLVEPRAPLLAAHRGPIGYANVRPDDDGLLRQLTTTGRASDFLDSGADASEAVLPSLAAAAAQALRPGVPPPAQTGLIDFRGPPETIPWLPIEDVFLPDRWDGSWLLSGRLFRDRVVWVGARSEVRFKDYYATPLGRMAGVEAQANALETLLGHGPLQRFSSAAAGACVWLFAATGLLVTVLCRRIAVQLAVLAGGALLWTGLAFVLFSTSGVVLPLFAPLGAWVMAGGAGVGTRFVTEQRERRRLRGVLARYVSEEVAQVIADQPDEFSQSLRGSRRAVTVLFADLRGFTTWVETAEPEIFVAQLNEYFHAVVDCVLVQGGTLQKFIGDAVLAVWGDTRTAGPAADAARAVDAALAMQAAVAQLNASWAGRTDRAPMTIGIGLHHGMAMVGNVGHPRRMEFTVLGDVVNVASRLESANKQLGTSLLVSDAIRDLTIDSHRCGSLGRVILKGKRDAIGLFAPVGLRTAPTPEWFEAAETANGAMTAGDFSRAVATYDRLAAEPGPLSDCFQHLAAICRRHAAAPPADWRGVRRLDEK